MEIEHEYCGECIFCTSKCPECGSTNIEVKYSISGSYQNDIQNVLALNHEIERLEMICEDCGECFEHSEWGKDERLSKLIKAIYEFFNFPTFVSMDEPDENGAIKFKRTYVGGTQHQRR